MAHCLSIREQRLVAVQRARADFDQSMNKYQDALEATSQLKKKLTKAREDEDAA
jgi:exonuclease VII small subunit